MIRLVERKYHLLCTCVPYCHSWLSKLLFFHIKPSIKVYVRSIYSQIYEGSCSCIGTVCPAKKLVKDQKKNLWCFPVHNFNKGSFGFNEDFNLQSVIMVYGLRRGFWWKKKPVYFCPHVKDALLCFYSDSLVVILEFGGRIQLLPEKSFECTRWLALPNDDLKPKCECNLKREIKLLKTLHSAIIISIIGQNSFVKWEKNKL